MLEAAQTTGGPSVSERKPRDKAAAPRAFFPTQKQNEAEALVRVTLGNGFTSTCSRGTRYPERASSFHTTRPRDLLGTSQQILDSHAALHLLIRTPQGGSRHQDRINESHRNKETVTNPYEFKMWCFLVGLVLAPRGFLRFIDSECSSALLQAAGVSIGRSSITYQRLYVSLLQGRRITD